MSNPRLVRLIAVVVVSVVLGVGAGHWFYRLYVDSIPEALKATTSLSGTHLVFLWNGFLLGVIVAVWALVVSLFARLFQARDDDDRSVP